MPNPFFTIGHSTRPTEEFVALLKAAEAQVVIDVRTVPRSRTNPQFNRDVLPFSLTPHGLAYEHLVSLGGLRGLQRNVSLETNAFWENASFHNFADYAMGQEFAQVLRNCANWGMRRARPSCAPRPSGGAVIAASLQTTLSPRARRSSTFSAPATSSRRICARGADRAEWDADLSERIPLLARRSAMNRSQESLRPLVAAVRSLLETAGPEAHAFLRDWPRELVARPTEARSLPVVSALEGLSRYAAPRTRALVEAIAALASELDWRQTYSSADFGERFLENYGFSEWIGRRGAFASDAIACGILILGPETEYPAHSHEAEELYLPLAGHASWRSANPIGGFSRPGHGFIIPPGRPTPCERAPSLCSRPTSGARATLRRNLASTIKPAKSGRLG